MPSRKTNRRAPIPPPPPAPAMRLIFEYEGETLRLVSQQPVDMAVTGTDLAQQYTAGTFVDARDATDRTLARVHARGMSESAEVFPESPGDPIVHVALERPSGAFTVVLPAPQAATRVAVVRVRPGAVTRDQAAGAALAGAGAAPALQTTDLASFPLQRKP
ncbi:hypothetical protein QTH97_24375 [Variovorax sp. J22R24]|uniref:hypothetical protein n=1 Tax=Variovorax gracilis TaxID=3053502 RepID=UPI002575CF59|nr:hypothetical protein [Variovorax sp. J22R24]MDM0108107.1 hypothetical protein [Variovorax sp. J22R24]